MFTKQKNLLNRLQDIQISVAHLIVKLLKNTPVTANQVTIFRIILTIPISFYLFSQGQHLYNLIALIFVLAMMTLDFVDGELAREKNITSKLGKYLDEGFDMVIVLTILFSIFIGVLKATNHKDLWSIFFTFFVINNLYQIILLNEFSKKTTYTLTSENEFLNIEAKYKLNNILTFVDKFFLSLIDVHRSSISKVCFTISYALMITILIDQIFFCFAFLSITYFLRNIFLLYINIVLSSDIKTNVGVLNFLREDIKNK